LLEQKIFGTLPNVESVNEKMIRLLRRVESDRDSSVSMMVYWMWFGADLKYPTVPIDKLNMHDSELCELIQTRLSQGRKTHVVMYEQGQTITGSPSAAKDKLKTFVEAVLRYRAKDRAAEIKPEDVTNLLSRYEESVKILKQMEAQMPANGSEEKQIEVKRFPDIPNLLFAVKGDGMEAGIIYLGETPTLEHFIETAGFYTEDPKMVRILERQIREFERQP
jgi:hypothetical protein